MPSPASPASRAAVQDSHGVLVHLLERFKDAVPGVVVAELATTDGLPRAFVEMDQASAERLAAVAASLHSLGRGIGQALGQPERRHLKQAFIETDTERAFAMNAAEGTLLTVITSLDADPVLTGYEMARLIASVRPHLGTPTRSTGQAGGDEW